MINKPTNEVFRWVKSFFREARGASAQPFPFAFVADGG